MHREWLLAPLCYAPIAGWTRPGPTCTLTWQTLLFQQNNNIAWKDNTACTYRLPKSSLQSTLHNPKCYFFLLNRTHTHEFIIIPSSVHCHSHNLIQFRLSKHLLEIVFLKTEKANFRSSHGARVFSLPVLSLYEERGRRG